uniref:Uncharacterized protein n=1 Tax=Zhangzhou Chrys tick virus 3 TaxID=2972088 RepID=A0A9E7V1T0_9VIRU|nr:MAG: hypothetical protein [Zhangzhou Chrys tick virus 3]
MSREMVLYVTGEESVAERAGFFGHVKELSVIGETKPGRDTQPGEEVDEDEEARERWHCWCHGYYVGARRCGNGKNVSAMSNDERWELHDRLSHADWNGWSARKLFAWFGDAQMEIDVRVGIVKSGGALRQADGKKQSIVRGAAQKAYWLRTGHNWKNRGWLVPTGSSETKVSEALEANYLLFPAMRKEYLEEHFGGEVAESIMESVFPVYPE